MVSAAYIAVCPLWPRRRIGSGNATLGRVGSNPTGGRVVAVNFFGTCFQYSIEAGTALTQARSIRTHSLSGLGEPGRRCSLGEPRRGSSLLWVHVQPEAFKILSHERAPVAAEEFLSDDIKGPVRLSRFDDVQADWTRY